jgi:hypothetical protein
MKWKLSQKNKNILTLYSTGQINYETAVFAIKGSLNNLLNQYQYNK